jgi:hypothetical protein
LGERLLQSGIADITPRTDDIGVNLDAHWRSIGVRWPYRQERGEAGQGA